MTLLEERDGQVLLRVRVSPGARHERILGRHGEALKVAVAAPPEKGKANRRLLEVLARELDLPLRSLEVTRGAASRDKVVAVSGVSADTLRELLSHHLASP